MEEQQMDSRPPKKKMKHDKDKPWDDESIDHWKVEPFLPEQNKAGMLEESSFAIMFPKYREQYLQQVWPAAKSALSKSHIGAELDLRQGTMTVRTTRKTFDPFVIMKARDLLKLLARGVPLTQSIKILEDDTQCDVIAINGFVQNKERFHRRRQRLLGPKGTTLKALEILTDCYIKVQGNTVSVMGPWKGLKMVRKVVEDCMNNIHPVYHVKRLMVKRQLANDPSMANENWERFLPKFKKKNVSRKKPKKVKDKKDYTPFPPAQQPRKVDLQIESGEYFLSEQDKERKKRLEKSEQQQAKLLEKKREREQAFQPTKAKSKFQDQTNKSKEEDVLNLVQSLKRKKSGVVEQEIQQPQAVDGKQESKKPQKKKKKQKL